MGVPHFHPQVVVQATDKPPDVYVSDRPTQSGAPDLEKNVPELRVESQSDSRRIRSSLSRVCRTADDSTSAGDIPQPRCNLVRVNRRVQGGSASGEDAHRPSRLVCERISEVRQGQVFCSSKRDRTEEQIARSVGHVPVKQIRKSDALQSIPCSRRETSNATRRLHVRDRPEKILPLPRAKRKEQGQSLNLGRPQRVDSHDIFDRRTGDTSGTDSSVRLARRPESDGKIITAGRSVNPSAGFSINTRNGRSPRVVSIDDGTCVSDEVDDYAFDDTRFSYFVEEESDETGTFYRVLRNVMELLPKRSVHSQEEKDENFSVSTPSFEAPSGHSFSSGQYRRQNTECKDSVIPSSLVAQRESEMGDPDLATCGLVRTQVAFTGSEDGARVMERPAVEAQRSERQTSGYFDSSSGRRSGIRNRGDALRHARSDLRSMAEWKRSVFERARATGRHNHGNVLYSPARPQEHYAGSSIRQYDEHVLPQQTRGPDPVVRPTDTRLSGVVFPRAEYQLAKWR